MNTPAIARPSRSRWWLRILGWGMAGLLALVLTAAVSGWWALRASLPVLEGELPLRGLATPARVLRDAEGVATVQATTQPDLAFALGYVHAQERFFQMDLQRRAPAGELAALLGPKVLPSDRRQRPHGLRAVARSVVAAAGPADRAVIDAYTAGVNAGLAGLGARPWEYFLLRQQPQPWRPEDTVLTVHAMFLTLQDSEGSVERQRTVIRNAQPELETFLFSPPGQWQAPLFGGAFPDVPVPAAAVDVRLAAWQRSAGEPVRRWARQAPSPAESGLLDWAAGWRGNEADAVVGSNNWALSGRHTASGAALVADDMHLALRMPHIWFRARLELRDATGALRSAVTGVSLPGTPMIVAGSNGHIAWGFTNSNVDSTDTVVLVPDPTAPGHYLTPDGSRPLQRRMEVIEVSGAEPVTLEVVSSEFGPVLARDPAGRDIAVQWVPHFTAGTNFRATALVEARSVPAALAIAREGGIPAQNLTVGDAAGDIAWTLMGQVPQRTGEAAVVSRLSTDPAARWQGVGPPPATLARINPAGGRIWTANSRVGGATTDGLSADESAAVAAYDALGGSRFDRGARNRQIRDGLVTLQRATPADFLALHLDDRAVFVQSWQPLAVEVAGLAKVAAAERALLATPFTHAAVDSVSYRLVRAFHREATRAVWSVLTAPAQAVAGELELRAPPEFEGALWQLVGPGRDVRWNAVLVKALETALSEERQACGGTLEGCTWGRFNTVRFHHPLAAAVPAIGRWVNLPDRALPGDSDLPRVQRREHGASQRFAVSPGRESEGYHQVPGGNAGHPLSPYHGAGHAAWERGEPAPFLPGETRWTLQLQPSP